MDVFTVVVREKGGTGPARDSRRRNKVPGVLYGGSQEPIKIEMPKNEVLKSYHAGNMQTSIAILRHNDKDQKILPREIQLHPISGLPTHVDFLRVTDSTIINVEINVQFNNAELCKGIKRGGTLNIVRHTVEVNVPAGSIPELFEIDLEELDIGDSVHISNINLPKNCKPVISDRDFTIATIATPSGSSADDDDDDKNEASTTATGESESEEPANEKQ